MNSGESEITAPHNNAGLDDQISSSRRGSVFLDILFYRTGFPETENRGKSHFPLLRALLAGRPNLCGCGAILDDAEVPCDPIGTYIEWIRFTRLAVCGAVGFEEGVVELGVIRHQRCCAVVGSGPRHPLRRGNVAVIVCGAGIKGNGRPSDVSDTQRLAVISHFN